MIAFNTDIERVEIGEFYYFRSSYPADFDEIVEEAGDSGDLSSTTERAGATQRPA